MLFIGQFIKCVLEHLDYATVHDITYFLMMLWKQTNCEKKHLSLNRCSHSASHSGFIVTCWHWDDCSVGTDCTMTRSVPCGPCDDIICWLCDPKLCNPLLLSPFNCGLVCVPLWCRTEAWGRAIHAWLSWRWELHYCDWDRPNTCFCSSEQVEFEEAGTGSSRGGRLGYKWKHFF